MREANSESGLGHPFVIAVRLLAGVILGFVVLAIVLGPYVASLARVLDATIPVWEPAGLAVSAVERDETSLRLYYAPDERFAEAGVNRTAFDQWFYYDLAAIGTWDLAILVAVFVGLASGPWRRAVLHFVLAFAALFLLDVVAFAALFRYGYDAAADVYSTQGVFWVGAWMQQIVPVVVALVACPGFLRELGARAERARPSTR